MSGTAQYCKKQQIHNYPTPKTKTNTTQNNERYNTKNTGNNTKWATFTFTYPHIRKITDLFKHTNVKIAFRHNTIARLTKPTNFHKISPHNKWGIYQLTCNSCDLSYVDQTSRSLKIRYQEHIRYIRSNNKTDGICTAHLTQST